jgi:putative hydrolase of HD superfamily
MNDRLRKQLDFMLELDKMKNLYRQTYVLHEDRKENDAEHSWHIAVLASLLAEYSNEPIDVAHVTKMVLLHDVVEIDAGDTY